MNFNQSFSRCLSLYKENKYDKALFYLNDFETVFGEEDEFYEENINQSFLYIKALCCMNTSAYSEAIEALELCVEFKKEKAERLRDLHFCLGVCFLELGENDRCLSEFLPLLESVDCIEDREFIQYFILKAYRQKKSLREFKLFRDQSSFITDWILVELDQLELELLLDEGRLVAALKLLESYQWHDRELIDPVSLSYILWRLVYGFLEEEENEYALNVIRYIAPFKSLIQQQEDKLYRYRHSLIKSLDSVDSLIRKYAYQYFFNKVFRAQQFILSQDDFTEQLLFKKAQLYLACSRYYEAEVLLRNLLKLEGLEEDRRRSLHYMLISCLQGMQKYQAAICESKNLLSNSIETKEILESYFVILEILIAEEEYTEALALLADLLSEFSESNLVSEIFYFKAIVYYKIHKFEESKKCFSKYISSGDTENLFLAKFHYACCELGLANYKEADEIFKSLLCVKDLPYAFQAQLRLKSLEAKYALGSINELICETKKYLLEYSTGELETAFRIFLSTCYESKNEPFRALSNYLLINDNYSSSYIYATFKVGELYLKTGQYEKLKAHFIRYTQKDIQQCIPRWSEAVNYIIKSHYLLGQKREAKSLLRCSIMDQLNKPYIEDLSLLLDEYFLNKDYFDHRDDFELILFKWIESSLKDKHFLAYARLLCYALNHIEKIEKKSSVEIALLALPQYLDLSSLCNENLLLISNYIFSIDPSYAEKCLELIIERKFDPNSASKALFGMAQLSLNNSQIADAYSYIIQSEYYVEENFKAKVFLLKSEILIAQGDELMARGLLLDVLKLGVENPRIHAKSLLILARLSEKDFRDEDALIFYTRLYNMYRTEVDLQAQAYYQSARILYKNDQHQNALAVLDEFLGQKKFLKDNSYTLVKEFYRKIMMEMKP